MEKMNVHNKQRQTNKFLPAEIMYDSYAVEDAFLYSQQVELSDIFERAVSCDDALQLLRASGLANTSWEVEKWQPYMLETAMAITQKWKNGFV